MTQSPGALTDTLSTTIRPQDDFYRHVNGAWWDAHVIPDDRAADGSFHHLRDDAELHVREIIEEAPRDSLIGGLYASFMDEARADARGVEPLVDELAAIDEAGSPEFLARVMGALQRLGVGGMVAYGVSASMDDPDRTVLYLAQGGIGLPDESYYRDPLHAETLAKYLVHVDRMAGLVEDAFGADGFTGAGIVATETLIAKHHWDIVKSREAELVNNPRTLTELEAEAPGFPWRAWADAIHLPDVGHDALIAEQPSFFIAMGELWNTLPLAELKAWLRWRVVCARVPYLTAALSRANFEFYGTVLSGAPVQRERWKRGVGLVEGVAGEAVGAEYVKRHFPPAHKERMEALVANLVLAYEDSIRGLEWMSADTKEKALAKLRKFVPKIGYPDTWRDFTGLDVSPDDVIANLRAAHAFNEDWEWGKLGKPVDRTEWLMTPQTVNAYYMATSNEIAFPAAILQPPFFDAEADDAANYGAIGSVIGHEMGHGFDDQGSKFDGDGRLSDWWTAEDRAAFAELAQDVYRPLTTISYAFDYRFWGLNTFGYHLENVVLHALNAILLFGLLQLIFGDLLIAFLASALFVCHPVQTEVVAWISGRSSLLFLFFYLASFICYALFRKKWGKWYIVLSLALFFKSLFSKEMAISLPLLLVAYDIHFPVKESLKRKALGLAPYFLLAAFFVIARSLVIDRVSQCGWWGGSPYYTFLTMLSVLGEYLKLLVLPVKLCAFYVTAVCASIASTNVLLPAVFLVLLAGALPTIFRRSRKISFAICFFFITLLPVSNIVPLKALMAERFLYLPSIGFYIIAAAGLSKLMRSNARARKLAIIIAAALVLAYSVRTMMRNEDWKNPIAITSSILKIDPLNPWALTALGAAYSDQGQYEMAIKPLVKATMLTKDYFAAKNVLGFCYLELGRFDEAISVLTDALKINPFNLEALSSMGVAHAQLKKHDEAVQYFERALKVDPSFVDGYINLATAYEQMGKPEKAIEIYEKAISGTKSAQSIAIIYVRMGDVYAKLNNADTTRMYYEKAIGLCGAGMEELKVVAEGRLNRKL